MTATDYDSFANAYSAENESNLCNAYYERPEMLRLAGDVSGCRILDAGCGSGPLSVGSTARQGPPRHRLRRERSHGRAWVTTRTST
jgi:2-polyprenyl-3-methyl-5-hydroxy-6-metoxy-1,4-benzoquinol methylase